MGAQGLIAVGVPPQPLWLLYIKIAVLVITLIVLALSAYALSLFPASAGGMDIFIAIFSLIVYGTAASLEIWAPQHFYRIGALVGYILTVIFWLAAWAWSASDASIWLRGSDYYGGYTALGGSLAGCAGLGAVAWVLVIVHLAFFIRACVVDTTASGQAELGQVRVEMPPQQPYPASQPAYPQQQQQQQQAYPAQQPYPAQPGYPQQQPYPGQ